MTTPPPAISRPLWRSALRIALIYAVVAMTWIISTDVGLAIIAGQPVRSMETVGSMAKGALFVAVTASLLFALVHRALRRLQMSEHELRASRERYRRVTESNIIGVFSWTTDGAVTHANDAFLQMVGYSADDVERGRVRWTDMTPPEHRPADARAMAELRETGAFAPFEKEYVRKDGARVAVLLGGASLAGSTSEGVSFVLDISARKQAQAELRAAKEAAESANKAKDRFLAVLSHELRTPLAPVLLILGAMVRNKSLPPNELADINLVRRNIELEAHLIDDLLDVSRIAQGKLALDFEEVEVAALARHAAQICSPDAHAKGVTLAVQLDERPLTVRADPARLLQVLWNLLNNAVKFTPRGGTITLKSEADGAQVRVTVSDTGCGIEPAVLPQLFHPFEQGTLRVGTAGGLGLGLAIAQSIALAHDGSLTGESRGPGQGAAFTLVLPLLRDTARSAAKIPASRPAEQARGSGQGQAGLRILLVEDHADTAMVMSRLLRTMGHSVVVAGTVQAACQSLRSGAFDFLISDIGLPDGTGLDVLAHMPASPIPAVAISGFAMPEDIERSLAAGFMQHLVKPIDPAALESLLAGVLAKRAERLTPA